MICIRVQATGSDSCTHTGDSVDDRVKFTHRVLEGSLATLAFAWNQRFRGSSTPAHRALVCGGDVCGKREGLGNMVELGSVD